MWTLQLQSKCSKVCPYLHLKMKKSTMRQTSSKSWSVMPCLSPRKSRKRPTWMSRTLVEVHAFTSRRSARESHSCLKALTLKTQVLCQTLNAGSQNGSNLAIRNWQRSVEFILKAHRVMPKSTLMSLRILELPQLAKCRPAKTPIVTRGAESDISVEWLAKTSVLMTLNQTN